MSRWLDGEIRREEVYGLDDLRAGDILLFHYPRSCSVTGLCRSWIERVQRRLLVDLGGMPACMAWLYARYTHVGMAAMQSLGTFDVPGIRANSIVEMTTPRCRIGRWEDVPYGTELLVRRLADDEPGAYGTLAVAHGMDEAREGVPYPYTELLSYWVWSWYIGKLTLGRRFRDIFTCPERDVCSGSVWCWLSEAGAVPCHERPEAWYPARFAAENSLFRTVGVWRLI